ncbi:MAG: class I SAM-dependent methyltransferase, partial [Acidobacteriota bacterium]
MADDVPRIQLAAADTLGGYDRWAPSYDVEPNALIAATAWVLERAPLGCSGVDVLDVGCGTGRAAQRVLAEGARSYTGLDGSQGMLAVATQRYRDPRISFGLVDLLAPWSLPRQFDFALVSLVLEHLPSVDALLVSLARAIKPGGRVRIVDLHPERVATGSSAPPPRPPRRPPPRAPHPPPVRCPPAIRPLPAIRRPPMRRRRAARRRRVTTRCRSTGRPPRTAR